MEKHAKSYRILLLAIVYGCFLYIFMFYYMDILKRPITITAVNHIHEKKERTNGEKPKLMLAIGILSMLSSINRRSAIRLTWLKLCRERQKEVFCSFFTDSLTDLNETDRVRYKEEKEINKDLLYMPFKGGHNFALRLIWMLQWYLKRFNFQYFLRIDDDYFLCLDRLLLELPHRPQTGLCWGWLHCYYKNQLRVDEGWMILSRDLIEESINKLNTTLLCHPFGDQAVALWLQESKINVTYFVDNERLDHHGLFSSKLSTTGNICERYIGFHRAYPKEMLVFGSLTQNYHNGTKNKTSYDIPDMKPFQEVCSFANNFDWRSFPPPYMHKPKLCKNNPAWEITNLKFEGREEVS